MVHKQPMSCDAQLTFLFGGIFQGVNVRGIFRGECLWLCFGKFVGVYCVQGKCSTGIVRGVSKSPGMMTVVAVVIWGIRVKTLTHRPTHRENDRQLLNGYILSAQPAEVLFTGKLSSENNNVIITINTD